MKRNLLFSILIFLSLISLASAQGGFKIGLSTPLLVPFKTYESYGTGFGVDVWTEYLFDTEFYALTFINFSLVGSFGYFSFQDGERKELDYQLYSSYKGIPVKAGGRMYIAASYVKPYVQALGGYMIQTGNKKEENVWGGGLEVPLKDDPFLSPSLGVLIIGGQVDYDFSAEAYIPLEDDPVALGIRIGFKFRP